MVYGQAGSCAGNALVAEKMLAGAKVMGGLINGGGFGAAHRMGAGQGYKKVLRPIFYFNIFNIK